MENQSSAAPAPSPSSAAAMRQGLEALEMMLEFPKTGPSSTAARAAIAALSAELEKTK